jgi:hypothetical protein
MISIEAMAPEVAVSLLGLLASALIASTTGLPFGERDVNPSYLGLKRPKIRSTIF